MLDLIPTASDLQSANADYRCRCNGHADESTAILSSEETPADFVESYEAYTLDQEIQRADDAARAELAATFTAAKAAVGNARIRLSRSVIVGDASGERADKLEYYCTIETHAARAFGVGVSPAAALADAIDELDKNIGRRFGGFRIDGVATVESLPHRTRSEALSIARRIVLDAAYLDGAVEFALPGIVDERGRSIPIIAA